MATGFAIELRESRNKYCPGRACVNAVREATKQNNGTCVSAMSVADGFPVRCVGDWAYRKIYYLSQYLGIFTGVGKKWGHLNYIEICSGPGRCILRGRGQEVDGTALRILNNERFDCITNAVFIDRDAETVDVLSRRIAALGVEGKAVATVADYTDPASIISACAHLPHGSLNLLFIDPTDCSMPFDTVRQVVEHLEHVDLLINFADGSDANRNLANTIADPAGHPNAYPKYAAFLGSTTFFDDPEIIGLAKRRKHGQLRHRFTQFYLDQLRTLHFLHFRDIPVRHLYRLLFACRHERGAQFWDEITKKTEWGVPVQVQTEFYLS